jgi:hypothetical protein
MPAQAGICQQRSQAGTLMDRFVACGAVMRLGEMGRPDQLATIWWIRVLRSRRAPLVTLFSPAAPSFFAPEESPDYIAGKFTM